MSKYGNLPIVISVTSDNTIDAAKLKAHGVGCVMARCSDGKQLRTGSGYDVSVFTDERFSIVVDDCYKNGISVGAVHVFRTDIIQSSDKASDMQFKSLVYALKNKKYGISYKFIVLDVTALGDTDSNIRTKVAVFSNWINETFPGVPLVIYTTDGYIQMFPSLTTLVARKDASWDMFMAQWQPNAKFVSTTWDALSGIMPDDSVKVITPGFASWMFYQWGVVSGLDGTSGLVGISCFNGTPLALTGKVQSTEAAVVVAAPEVPIVVDVADAVNDTVDAVVSDNVDIDFGPLTTMEAIMDLTAAVEDLTSALRDIFHV